MNRKAFIIFLFMAVLVIFGLGSCHSNMGPNEVRNPGNSLDWEGVYTGSFMTGSGHIRNIRMKLNRDQTFESYHENVDKPDRSFTLQGRFKWDDTGRFIMIDVIDAPMQFEVAKNRLVRMDTFYYILVKEQCL